MRLSALAFLIGAVVGGGTIVAIGYFDFGVDGIVGLPAAFLAAAVGTTLVAMRTARSGKG